MSTFLLKVNPKGCPAGISRPVSAGDWEKQPFEMPLLATMSGSAPHAPAYGDTIEIWVSERPRDRTSVVGRGYTGRASVSKIIGTHMWLENVDLFNSPLEGKRLLALGGDVLNWINAHRRPRLVLMSDDEAEELRSAIIQVYIASVPRGLELPNNDSAPSAEDASANVFDPSNVTDGRKRIIRSIAERRGQKAFRDTLRAAYVNRCAISNCDVLDVLEAAHIYPYCGPQTNSVTNGLLLRADLHTLFDCGLITIDPETFRVAVAMHLRKSDYGQWHGSAVRIPNALACRPSKTALAAHFQAYRGHSKVVQNS